MKFNRVEDRKVKIRLVDQKHPVKRTQRKQPLKAKKTKLSVSDRDGRKCNGGSATMMYGAGPMPDDPKLIGGAVTFEQAVEIAEEEAGRA